MRRPTQLSLSVAAAAAVVVLTVPTPATAATADIDGMQFTGDPAAPGLGATLTACLPAVADRIVVPQTVTIEGVAMDVVAIGANACSHSALGAQRRSLIVPDTVTQIGDSAFAALRLRSVDLGDGLIDIGAQAFRLNSLASLTLPDSLRTIGETAFQSNLISSLVIPEGVHTVGASAFELNLLTSLTLPESLTTITNTAFMGNLLTHVDIPATVTLVDYQAFAWNHLTSVTFLGNALTSIGSYAFWHNALTDIYVPDGVVNIRTGAFSENPLVSVRVPASTLSIQSTGLGTTPLDSILFEGDQPTLSSMWANITGTTVQHYKGAVGFMPGHWPGVNLVELVKVTFDTGGFVTTPPVMTTPTGSAVTPPTPQNRPTFDFAGWFDAPAGGSPVDFSSVNDHITAYAQWVDIPESLNAPAGAVAGTTVTLTGAGFQAGEPLEVWLLSTPVQLASPNADAAGTFSATVTIPANVTPGAHILEVRGAQSPTLSQGFTVFAALPETGPSDSVGPAAIAAVVLIAAGAGLLIARQRHH